MRESTLREILVSYERKRDKAESELEYRIKDVYSQIPEIKSIVNEVNKIGLELAKLVLLNPQDKDSIIAQSKDKMKELKLKKEELLNRYKHRHPPALLYQTIILHLYKIMSGSINFVEINICSSNWPTIHTQGCISTLHITYFF